MLRHAGRAGRHPRRARTGRLSPACSRRSRVGPVTLRNRIVSSGHDTVMAADGRVPDRLVAYQEARARGGAGLIVIQVGRRPPDRPLHLARADGRRRRVHPGLRAPGRGGPRARRRGLRPAVPRRARDHGHRGGHARRRAARRRAVPTERFHVMPRAMPAPLIARDRRRGSARRPRAWRRPGSTVSRSSPRTATCRRSSSTRARTCGPTRTAATRRRRLRFLREALAACRAATAARASPSACGSRSAR